MARARRLTFDEANCGCPEGYAVRRLSKASTHEDADAAIARASKKWPHAAEIIYAGVSGKLWVFYLKAGEP